MFRWDGKLHHVPCTHDTPMTPINGPTSLADQQLSQGHRSTQPCHHRLHLAHLHKNLDARFKDRSTAATGQASQQRHRRCLSHPESAEQPTRMTHSTIHQAGSREAEVMPMPWHLSSTRKVLQVQQLWLPRRPNPTMKKHCYVRRLPSMHRHQRSRNATRWLSSRLLMTLILVMSGK